MTGEGRDAAKRAARAALTDLGVTTPPGQWGDTEVEAALDVARVLADLAEAAATIRERRRDDRTWSAP